MIKLYRYKVADYGQEKALSGIDKILFINCPFSESYKVYSFPEKKFKKDVFERNLNKYQVKCVVYPGYSLLNVLIYVVLENLEAYHCICIEMAGFALDDVMKFKRFLLELQEHLSGKEILIVVKNDDPDMDEILLSFPVYHDNRIS